MVLTSHALATALGLALAVSPTRPADLDHPPFLIAAQLKALASRDLDRSRVEPLCANPVLRAYLHHFVRTNPAEFDHPDGRFVKKAMAFRILDRAEPWVKERQIDLLMEAGVMAAPLHEITTVKLVNRTYDVLRPMLDALHPLQNNETRNRAVKLTPLKERQVWRDSFFHGNRVTLENSGNSAYFAREIAAGDCNLGEIAFSSSGITRKQPPGWPRWDGLIVSGGDVSAGGLQHAILIADGDITLPEIDIHSGALVIATGNIGCKRADTLLTRCHLYAGGDIIGAGTIRAPQSVLRAGGKVICRNPEPEKIGNHVSGFDFSTIGLKFFKSEDVGVVLGGGAQEVTVKELTEKSPLRRALKVGDILTDINGRRVATRDDARRALREATVWEYAVVTLKRDGKELKELVSLPATLPKK